MPNYLIFLYVICLVVPQKLKIMTQNGTYAQMQYQAPTILKPKILQNISEQKPKDIGPINQQKISPILKDVFFDNRALGQLLYKNKDNFNHQIYQVQYYYYNYKYHLDQYIIPQKPICVVSPFYNFFSGENWKMYLDMLEYQNYTNFHIVMNDDVSTDNSANKIIDLVQSRYPRVSRRLTIVKNKQYVGMLGNHDISIRNICNPGQIVVQVDGDDSLLGLQVLKVLNTYYTKNPNYWVVHANMVFQLKEDIFTKFANMQIPTSILKRNQYRTSDKWLTSHLKSYYRDLYMKVPYNYHWRQQGKYYLFAGDLFLMFALIELASDGHVKYISQVFYFYRMSSGCGIKLSQLSECIARMLTPLMPLKNLNSLATLTPNYNKPLDYINKFNTKRTTAGECIKKVQQKINQPNFYTQLKKIPN